MRLKRLAYFLLGTLIYIHAKLIPLHQQKHHKLSNVVKPQLNYTRSENQEDAGAKRTWDCHRGCLRFCLPSCKKSCCQPGAKDFTPSMIREIEEFQGELKGSLEQRNAINEGSEEVEPFACGQFCSPECSPSCTIGCCTGTIPKDNFNTRKYMSSLLQAAGPLTLVKPVPAHKVPDRQMMLEMPCGEYCASLCAPLCSPDCCNSRGRRHKTVSPSSSSLQLTAEVVSSPVPDKKLMFAKPLGTCHIDCEKLCLPACEFVCCVPTKMRTLPFTKDVEMQFGLRKSIER